MKYVLESLELFVRSIINAEITADHNNKTEFVSLSKKVKRLEKLMLSEMEI
ncbi:hypothetical protein [Pedobacter nyackensis]|uniref:Uncharacterized protein n=1 Tax=Pedobacter nyackensis TaxID=475255 RepID=A0A1W2A201_9SPHI|nr:hypothetical protein [Pedobacter nyackensis]SMC54670.1 hypothetical protein SAMN04488101_101261 [Pedobacter nyackensis]